MKIMFVSAANSTHTVRWVNALAERGHEVYLVSNRGHEPKEDALNSRVKIILDETQWWQRLLSKCR